MVVFSGIITGKIKLALFSHRFDQKIGKIIIDRLIVESEDSEYPIENYTSNGKLENEKLIQDFLNKYYTNQPKDKYGEGIAQEILCFCLAIAGPVEGKKGSRIASVSRNSLEVTFTESDFKKSPISYVPVAFINDMPAIGESIFLTEYESDFTLLDDKRQTEEKGRKGLLLVEGGLGAAFWFNYNDNMSNLSSEYGHTLFSPRTEQEKIIANVLEKFCLDGVVQAISKEYALSGPGFLRIYEILKTPEIYNQETGSFQYSEQVGDLRERLEQVKDIEPQSVIKKAIDKSDSLAVKTLEIFVGIMGSVAGDFALIHQAKGGIYIGGYPDIFNLLREDNNLKTIFLEAFDDKEKGFRDYNAEIPVFIYEFKNSPLWGAARYAVAQGLVTKGKFDYEEYLLRQNQQS